MPSDDSSRGGVTGTSTWKTSATPVAERPDLQRRLGRQPEPPLGVDDLVAVRVRAAELVRGEHPADVVEEEGAKDLRDLDQDVRGGGTTGRDRGDRAHRHRRRTVLS